MLKSDNVGELAKALSAAQSQLKGAVRSAENPFFRSRYADLSSVWDACREALTKNGLSVVQTTSFSEIGVPVETTLLHTSGEWIGGTLLVKPVKEDPQAMGSAITYARRYALAAMVGVAPEDDDGNAASHNDGEESENSAPRPSVIPASRYPGKAQAVTHTPPAKDLWPPPPPMGKTETFGVSIQYPAGEGTVTFTESKKFGKREALSVTLANSAEKYYKCWESHQKGVPTLQLKTLISGGKGKHCKFIIEESEGKDGKKFFNIIGVLAIGEREFEADGTEIIKREAPTNEPYQATNDDLPEMFNS